MPIIEAEGLIQRYGDTEALQGLSFSVEPGEVFGFLGRNGAGKSTTVHILTTLLAPTAGTARVCGHDVRTEPLQVREHIGYVAQDNIADKYLTARENLRVVAGLYHMDRAVAERRIDELLELMALTDRGNDLVRKYSGGMRKRLDIACGLLHQPDLLFLDEPTLGLDVESRLRVWDYIRELRDSGTTIFLCTNYLDEADRLCDRLAILDQGRIQALGTPDELKDAVGGEVITLRFNGSTENLPAFKDQLQTQDYVHRIQETRGGWEVYVDVGSTAFPKLMEVAGAAGIRFDRIALGRLSLDDVFLSHIGRRMTNGDDTMSDGGA